MTTRGSERKPWWPRLWGHVAYWIFWATLAQFVRCYFRVAAKNAPRIKGPFVLVGSHVAFADPIIVGCVLRRRIAYVMSAIYYRNPRFGWFCRGSGTIPMSVTGSNREGLRAMRETLQDGRVLGIFPEGGISRDGLLQLGSPGAVASVLSEKVPVVPFAIIGGSKATPPGGRWRWRKITVRFGDPIRPEALMLAQEASRKQQLSFATHCIMDEIAALSGQISRETQLQQLEAAQG